VVLGVSHFGVRGAVLGPLLVSVPLICAEMLVVFNLSNAESRDTPSVSDSGRMSFSEAMRSSLIRITPQSSPLNWAGRQCSFSDVNEPENTPRTKSPPTPSKLREEKMKRMLVDKQKSLLLQEVLGRTEFPRRARKVHMRQAFEPKSTYPLQSGNSNESSVIQFEDAPVSDTLHRISKRYSTTITTGILRKSKADAKSSCDPPD